MNAPRKTVVREIGQTRRDGSCVVLADLRELVVPTKRRHALGLAVSIRQVQCPPCDVLERRAVPRRGAFVHGYGGIQLREHELVKEVPAHSEDDNPTEAAEHEGAAPKPLESLPHPHLLARDLLGRPGVHRPPWHGQLAPLDSVHCRIRELLLLQHHGDSQVAHDGVSVVNDERALIRRCFRAVRLVPMDVAGGVGRHGLGVPLVVDGGGAEGRGLRLRLLVILGIASSRVRNDGLAAAVASVAVTSLRLVALRASPHLPILLHGELACGDACRFLG
mmetsp:Transcript_31801/g.92938  ORF Transcript_31801/g.92938 Transcript_31801/m.92938 type:complete len:277 (-) Transcript_31801:119-949(-)